MFALCGGNVFFTFLSQEMTREGYNLLSDLLLNPYRRVATSKLITGFNVVAHLCMLYNKRRKKNNLFCLVVLYPFISIFYQKEAYFPLWDTSLPVEHKIFSREDVRCLEQV